MGEKLNIALEVQEPYREANNTILEFHITSGEISVSDKWKNFLPLVLVNGKEYDEYFFENLRVVVDSKKKDWPEKLPFRLVWDKENKKVLKGIIAYYDFLVFRKDGYYPENGLSDSEVMKQKVHFEVEKNP